MRMFLVLLFILASFNSFSSTSDSESFTFDGQRSSHEINLSTEKTHTEYRWERQADTCYRRVYVGDRYVCTTQYRQVCRTTQQTCRTVCTGSGANRTCRRECSGGGSRICRQEPYNYCRYIPQYRDEPYTCYRDVQVPYEVFDYFVESKITFDLSNSRSASKASEEFVANLEGDQFNLSLNSSGKYIVLADKEESSQRDGDVLRMEIKYKVKMIDFEKVAGAFDFGYTNAVVNSEGILVFIDLDKNTDYKHFLSIERKRFLRSPEVFFKNNLKASQITHDNGAFEIKFKDLGVNLRKGRYKVKISSALDLDTSKVLNREIIKKLKTEKSLKFKKKRDGSIKIK